MDASIIAGSLLLGVGLAMDAFSVSVADGMTRRGAGAGEGAAVAGTFAVFQFLMPLLGWAFVHTIVFRFSFLDRAVHLIGAGLLLFLGIRMILEQNEGKEEGADGAGGFPARGGSFIRMLLVQGIATSIDALSVGFAIADYTLAEALVCSALIGLVTLVMCLGGVRIGNGIGKKLTGYAGYAGGAILILIALRILAAEFIGG